MKRIAFAILCLVLARPIFAQDKAAQIADLQKQIDTIEGSYAPMEKRLDSLKTDQDNNKFAWDAYKKADDQYKTDIAAFNTKMDAANRAAALVQPALENWKQRLAAHNATTCTEHQRGDCDWWVKEAQSIDNQRDQINAAMAPVRAQYAALKPEGDRLDTTKTKLDTIYSQAVENDNKWRAGMTQLRSDFLAAQEKENELKRKLAVLQGDKNLCLKAIPAKCQKPAIDPATGKPILDQDCERMVAQCRAIFDGSKP